MAVYGLLLRHDIAVNSHTNYNEQHYAEEDEFLSKNLQSLLSHKNV